MSLCENLWTSALMLACQWTSAIPLHVHLSVPNTAQRSAICQNDAQHLIQTVGTASGCVLCLYQVCKVVVSCNSNGSNGCSRDRLCYQALVAAAGQVSVAAASPINSLCAFASMQGARSMIRQSLHRLSGRSQLSALWLCCSG